MTDFKKGGLFASPPSMSSSKKAHLSRVNTITCDVESLFINAPVLETINYVIEQIYVQTYQTYNLISCDVESLFITIPVLETINYIIQQIYVQTYQTYNLILCDVESLFITIPVLEIINYII